MNSQKILETTEKGAVGGRRAATAYYNSNAWPLVVSCASRLRLGEISEAVHDFFGLSRKSPRIVVLAVRQAA